MLTHLPALTHPRSTEVDVITDLVLVMPCSGIDTFPLSSYLVCKGIAFHENDPVGIVRIHTTAALGVLTDNLSLMYPTEVLVEATAEERSNEDTEHKQCQSVVYVNVLEPRLVWNTAAGLPAFNGGLVHVQAFWLQPCSLVGTVRTQFI